MHTSLRFETPENVQVRYEPAGLGTRFVAWFVDQVILFILMFVLMIALIAAGASFEFLQDAVDESSIHENHIEVAPYFIGLIILVWGLGSFVYFGCCELFLRGQTVGKRASRIRVIKSNGFQLDPGSILVRNLFRVIDHVPLMWAFPVLSKLSQRAGDMVAGTLVVFDSPTQFSAVRTALGARTAAEAQFRFDASMLKRLSGADFLAVERLLDRLSTVSIDDKTQLLHTYTTQLAKKLNIDPPPPSEQRRFLEDLFAAELRRQDRSLA